jgi:predicted transcriptional regulator
MPPLSHDDAPYMRAIWDLAFEGEDPTAEAIAERVGDDAGAVMRRLAGLVEEGYVVHNGDVYGLSGRGEQLLQGRR